MKYELEMRCEGDGSESASIEAEDLDEAIKMARKMTREWVRGGDWGEEGASVMAWWIITDEEGEEVERDGVTVEVAPDEDALISRAGGDPDCDHDWTSEGEGGCTENPGVWSTGGTSMEFASHCRKCGLQRYEHHCGSQRNPGDHDRVEFTQPASWCADCESEECSCSSEDEE